MHYKKPEVSLPSAVAACIALYSAAVGHNYAFFCDN